MEKAFQRIVGISCAILFVCMLVVVTSCGSDDDDDAAAPANAGAGGATDDATCSAGQSLCGNICVNTDYDPYHCGDCNSQCSSTEHCEDGTCEDDCSPLARCGDVCVDLDSSREYCSDCDTACQGDELCVDGACVAECSDATAIVCDHECTDPSSDLGHCGDCNAPCDDGFACYQGACTLVCPVGQTNCTDVCADLITDVLNCGACGNVCDPDSTCVNGTCESVCPIGFAYCDTDCVNLQSDPSHCGACGNACTTGTVCSLGSCEIVCGTGLTECGSSCANFLLDPSHCGACDNACSLGTFCANGSCDSVCPTGFTFCNSSCFDLQSDASNCGSCGNVCTASTVCSLGSCEIVCGIGLTECGSSCANQQTNLSHCGACDNTCPPVANGTPDCIGGSCDVGPCIMGYENCNVDPTDGCEVNTYFDDANCGSCGNACVDVPNSTAYCNSGSCDQNCDVGYANCNSGPGLPGWIDGCEADLLADVNNCSACGYSCLSREPSNMQTVSCTTASCVWGCDQGFADCNNSISDGCEVDARLDASNCGECGNVCGALTNGTSGCIMGTCVVASCNAGYEDCNNDPSDGCEANVTSDIANCGGCGIACNPPANTSSTQCNAGTCEIAQCTNPYMNCNGLYPDGCEIDRSSMDPNNCGSCGRVCDFTTWCTHSGCLPRGYAFAACKTFGWHGNINSACGTNMLVQSVCPTCHVINTVTSAELSSCHSMSFVPGGRYSLGVDYVASASTCDRSPMVVVKSAGGATLDSFSFGSCDTSGYAFANFILPAGENTFTVELYSGDWCASARIVAITQL